MNNIESILDLKSLPVPKHDCRAHYEGSIDKQGYNADWDWFLYEDGNGEWVIFEHLGPGCILNFVQHRYPACEEPEFRFYFDGEEVPRFTIRHSEFGEKYPLQEPAASRYIGPFDHGRGPIRVVRSFVPMAYEKSCKVTSTIKLVGNDKDKNEGGWGHVIYHSYESGRSIQTFMPGERQEFNRLTALWKQAGSAVHALEAPRYERHMGIVLEPGACISLLNLDRPGTIAGVRFLTEGYDEENLRELVITAWWDGHEDADVNAGFGCFFSNELGYHSVRYLLSGMDTLGNFYHFYPMHFGAGCRVCVTNRGTRRIVLPFAEIMYTEEWNGYYREHGFLYFRNSAYYDRKHTEGADSILARVTGNGHVISSVITAFGETPESRADCEGDVRVHIDGIRTPQIESDGSESYSCYGWGFETPQEYNPASGYDGDRHRCWSMHRSLMGDWYPFLSGFQFGIESGGCNDLYLEHSGMVFYYGRDEVLLKELGVIDFSDVSTMEALGYQAESPLSIVSLSSYFEGDEDETKVRMAGHYEAGFREFTVSLPEDTEALILRRVSDQRLGGQKALVFADGDAVSAGPWYCPDRNPYKRWLEDEYVIAGECLQGKTRVTIGILPVPGTQNPSSIVWNEFGYRIFARVLGTKS